MGALARGLACLHLGFRCAFRCVRRARRVACACRGACRLARRAPRRERAKRQRGWPATGRRCRQPTRRPASTRHGTRTPSIWTCSAAPRCSSGLARPPRRQARSLASWLLAPCRPRAHRSARQEAAVARLRRSTSGASSWPRTACSRRRAAAQRSSCFLAWAEGAGPRAVTRRWVAAPRGLPVDSRRSGCCCGCSLPAVHRRGVLADSARGRHHPVVRADAHDPEWLRSRRRRSARAARYAALFEHAVARAAPPAPLLRLQLRLSVARGLPAPACMRQLNRILGFAELRHSARRSSTFRSRR